MKKIFLLVAVGLLFTAANAQDFKTQAVAAKSSYTSGNLEDAHFTLQQMLQEIDVTIGKEVLKLLPLKMDTLSGNIKDDNVSGNVSFVGATIQRSYGFGEKKAEVEIVNNSPLLVSNECGVMNQCRLVKEFSLRTNSRFFVELRLCHSLVLYLSMAATLT